MSLAGPEEKSKPKIYEPISADAGILQGEIVCNLIQLVRALDEDDKSVLEMPTSNSILFIPKVHPYAIVVTQDCDLDWDFKARQGHPTPQKLIPSVLFCEVVKAADLKHNPTNPLTSKIWERVRENKDERYHFLQKVDPTDEALGEGLPELGVDFKRYFSLPTEEVYSQLRRSSIKRRCRLSSPYREHFATRFYYFQYRVALPEDHFSEKETAQPIKRA